MQEATLAELEARVLTERGASEMAWEVYCSLTHPEKRVLAFEEAVAARRRYIAAIQALLAARRAAAGRN